MPHGGWRPLPKHCEPCRLQLLLPRERDADSHGDAELDALSGRDGDADSVAGRHADAHAGCQPQRHRHGRCHVVANGEPVAGSYPHANPELDAGHHWDADGDAIDELVADEDAVPDRLGDQYPLAGADGDAVGLADGVGDALTDELADPDRERVAVAIPGLYADRDAEREPDRHIERRRDAIAVGDADAERHSLRLGHSGEHCLADRIRLARADALCYRDPLPACHCDPDWFGEPDGFAIADAELLAGGHAFDLRVADDECVAGADADADRLSLWNQQSGCDIDADDQPVSNDFPGADGLADELRQRDADGLAGRHP